MRKLWDKFVKLLYKVGQDKWFHFIAGLIFAAFPTIVFGWNWAPMVFAAFLFCNDGALQEGAAQLVNNHVARAVYFDFAVIAGD